MTISARIARIDHYFPYARPYENLTMNARNARNCKAGAL
jgi:hypothetical protein